MTQGMVAEVIVNKNFDPKTKPTIIFYHGFPDNKFSWMNQLRYFEKKGFNVMAPPMRGYEESFQPKDKYQDVTLISLAHDVETLIKNTGLDSQEAQVHIVGHDWGSPVV